MIKRIMSVILVVVLFSSLSFAKSGKEKGITIKAVEEVENTSVSINFSNSGLDVASVKAVKVQNKTAKSTESFSDVPCVDNVAVVSIEASVGDKLKIKFKIKKKWHNFKVKVKSGFEESPEVLITAETNDSNTKLIIDFSDSGIAVEEINKIKIRNKTDKSTEIFKNIIPVNGVAEIQLSGASLGDQLRVKFKYTDSEHKPHRIKRIITVENQKPLLDGIFAEAFYNDDTSGIVRVDLNNASQTILSLESIKVTRSDIVLADWTGGMIIDGGLSICPTDALIIGETVLVELRVITEAGAYNLALDIIVSDRPDLSIIGYSLEPEEVFCGEKFMLTAVVKELSNVKTKGRLIVENENGEIMGESPEVDFTAGETKEITLELVQGYSGEQVPHTIKLVNINIGIADKNESNNVMTASFPVYNVPDLTIDEVIVPEQIYQGMDFVTVVKVKEINMGHAWTNYTVQLFVENIGVIGESDVQSIENGSIQAVEIYAGLAESGSYEIEARISVSREETNTDNNSAVMIIDIIPVDITSGLITSLTFDDGTTQDSSGYNMHGLAYNIDFVEDRHGVPNSAVYFDNSTSYWGDYIKIPINPTLSSLRKVTVSMFVKPMEKSGFVFSADANNGSPNLSARCWKSSTDFEIGRYTNGLHGNSTVTFDSNDNWFHVAFSYNGTHCKTYINGVLKDSSDSLFRNHSENTGLTAPEDYLRVTTSKGLVFGQKNYDPGRNSWQVQGWTCYNGCIDQVKIYNRALTDAEVMLLSTQ
jgi:hypothetical protein